MLCLMSQIHLVPNFSLYAWNNESLKIFLLAARRRAPINNAGRKCVLLIFLLQTLVSSLFLGLFQPPFWMILLCFKFISEVRMIFFGKTFKLSHSVNIQMKGNTIFFLQLTELFFMWNRIIVSCTFYQSMTTVKCQEPTEVWNHRSTKIKNK